jgi:hypothetical protein
MSSKRQKHDPVVVGKVGEEETDQDEQEKKEYSMDELRNIVEKILDCAEDLDAMGVHRNLQRFRIQCDAEMGSGYIGRLMTRMTPSETLAPAAKSELFQRIRNVADHISVVPIESFASVTTSTPLTRRPTRLRFTIDCGRVSAAFVPKNQEEPTLCALRLMNGTWFATQKATAHHATIPYDIGNLRVEFLVAVTEEEAETYLVAARRAGGKREIVEVPDVFRGILSSALHDSNRKVTVVAAYAVPLDPHEASPANLGTELSKFAYWSCPVKKRDIVRYCSLVQTALTSPLESFFTKVMPVEK